MKAVSGRLTELLGKHTDLGPRYGMRAVANFCSAGSTDFQSINSDLSNCFRYETPQDESSYAIPARAKIHFQASECKAAIGDLEG